MSKLRDKFDKRPITHGIKVKGSQRVVSNQIGKHIYHAGEEVELHCRDSVVYVEIIGTANDHMIGKITGFDNGKEEYEEMKVGQKITFDEVHIFKCFED